MNQDIKAELGKVAKVVQSLNEDFQACIERTQTLLAELETILSPTADDASQELPVCISCHIAISPDELSRVLKGGTLVDGEHIHESCYLVND